MSKGEARAAEQIPLSRPVIGEEEMNAVREALASGWLTHGPQNAEFERRFAEYLGVADAVCVNSCASALFLAIKAHGIGGEVILPSFTFAASANAIVTAGATPVFADIDPETMNLDPADVERRISPATEAIMPVHFAGQTCDMERLGAIAARHGLALIEDSAETLGGTWDGRQAGSFGTGCFSFFPTKNITTGEGGMVTTNDAALASRVRTLAAHGIPRSTMERATTARPWQRSAVLPGWNMRMSSVQAAIGVEQMKRLDDMNRRRREHAAVLSQVLRGVEGVTIPWENPRALHVYQMYTILVDGVDRDDFVERLRGLGIGASVHFDPPVHLQDFYRQSGHAVERLPVTESVSARIVTLPMYPQLTRAELDRIGECVEQAFSCATVPA